MENPNACANCNWRLITEADKATAKAADAAYLDWSGGGPRPPGGLLLLMCDACITRMEESRRERAPRAAQIHAALLEAIAAGLTLKMIKQATRRGEDLFGVCSMTKAEFNDWMLCAEQACELSPWGSEERRIVGSVRHYADNMRRKHRKQQREAQPPRLVMDTLPRGGRIDAQRRANAALDADFQYQEAA